MWTLVSATAKKKTDPAPFCQDKVAGSVGLDLSVLCVSDGLGSCALSHVGARCAVRHFVSEAPRVHACSSPEGKEQAFCASLDRFRGRISALARKRGCTEDVFASTLVLVLVSPEAVWGVRVGDGFAVARFREQFVSLFPVNNGARDITETLLGSQVQYEVCCEEKAAAFAMCSSDGLYDLTYDMAASEPHQVFFKDFEGGLMRSRSSQRYLQRVLKASLERDPTDDKGVVVLLQKFC